jgi:hypothetical protein
MSRSFKHNPISKNNDKFFKNYSNKKVRKEDFSDGSSYKKAINQYDISDYKSNLYKVYKKDGVPFYRWLKRKLTINEIMEYWRK